jgi:hypothetical protein
MDRPRHDVVKLKRRNRLADLGCAFRVEAFGVDPPLIDIALKLFWLPRLDPFGVQRPKQID